MNIDARIDKLELRVDRTLNLMRKINEKYADILSAQKHYLKKRAPAVLAKQRNRYGLEKNLKLLEKKIAKIPKLSVSFTRKAKGRDTQSVVLMVDHNQARKIRHLADMNMQGMIGKINYLIRISHDLKKVAKGQKCNSIKSSARRNRKTLQSEPLS